MEKFISHEIERLPNGNRIVRNYFFNEVGVNYLQLAHSHFTKHEKKVAKLLNKNR